MDSKRIYLFITLLLVFLLSLNLVHAVGIRRFVYDVPAYEFEPGLEATIQYEVLHPTRDTVLTLSGEFAPYVELSRNKIPLSDSNRKFTMKIKLPESSEGFSPGKNIMWMTVQDDFSNIKKEGMFVVTTQARSPIVFYVPYPGYYAQISQYSLKNVNSGLDTNLKFTLWNRGKNNLINTNYEFVIKGEDGNVLLQTSEGGIDIETQTQKEFEASLDTSHFIPGYYNATLNYYYEDKIESKNSEFKVGQLNIEIVNHTKQLYNDSIQRFNIDVQSEWNAVIKDVYAEVNIEGRIAKTSPASLSNFEAKSLITHIDTSGIPIGDYNAEVRVFYLDKETHKELPIKLIERAEEKTPGIFANPLILILIIIIVLLFISSIFLIAIFMKNSNKEKHLLQSQQSVVANNNISKEEEKIRDDEKNEKE